MLRWLPKGILTWGEGAGTLPPLCMVIGCWLPWGGKETLVISLGNPHRGLRVESHLPASRGQIWAVHHGIPHAECELGFLRFSVSPVGDSHALPGWEPGMKTCHWLWRERKDTWVFSLWGQLYCYLPENSHSAYRTQIECHLLLWRLFDPFRQS